VCAAFRPAYACRGNLFLPPHDLTGNTLRGGARLPERAATDISGTATDVSRSEKGLGRKDRSLELNRVLSENRLTVGVARNGQFVVGSEGTDA